MNLHGKNCGHQGNLVRMSGHNALEVLSPLASQRRFCSRYHLVVATWYSLCLYEAEVDGQLLHFCEGCGQLCTYV